MKNVDLDLQSYTMKRFSDDFTFYWRILKDTDEFEGVAVVNGSSWVGVGWRPSSLTSACRATPEIRERGKKGTSPEPLPRPEPKSEPKSEPKVEPKTEPKSEPRSELQSEPEPEPEPGAEPERRTKVPVPEPEAEPEATELKFGGNNKRSAKQDAAVTARPGSDVTVQTSVTYRVSTKQGESDSRERCHERLAPANLTVCRFPPGRRKRSPQPEAQPTGELRTRPPPESQPPPQRPLILIIVSPCEIRIRRAVVPLNCNRRDVSRRRGS
jgi:hypothetical protein